MIDRKKCVLHLSRENLLVLNRFGWQVSKRNGQRRFEESQFTSIPANTQRFHNIAGKFH